MARFKSPDLDSLNGSVWFLPTLSGYGVMRRQSHLFRGARMITRISQILLVLCMGVHAALVAFGNITDHGANYPFVQHVMMMDTIFPGSGIHYRSIEAPLAHSAAFVLIILAEAATAVLCLAGGRQMLRARRKTDQEFRAAKTRAIQGLTLGFLTWQFMFATLGGEWFGMWMSHTWNGLDAAFRIAMTMLGVLIFTVLPASASAVER